MDEAVQEKVNTAVALQSLTSEIGFIKGQLTEMSSNMKAFVTKGELEEVKKDFGNTIKDIRDGFVKHSAEDVISFGSLQQGQEKLAKGQTNQLISNARWTGGGAVIIVLAQWLIPWLIAKLSTP